MDTLPFIIKYIPKDFNDIIGNIDLINTLNKYIKTNSTDNLIFVGPCGVGKTTIVNILVEKLNTNNKYKLYLNMSDIRGIDIVDSKIKGFLEKKISNDVILTIILDEIDFLTVRAQYYIRELLELYNNKTRFIFICNSTSNIIENIQNKCNLISFNKHSNNNTEKYIKKICEKEKLNPTQDGINALTFISNGDLRNTLNYIQQVSIIYPNFNKDNIYEVCDFPPPEFIKNILKLCTENDLINIIKKVNELYNNGYSFFDIINILFKIIKIYPLKEEKRLQIIKEVGYAHVRNASGNQSNLQLLRLFVLFAKIINSDK